MIEIYTNVRFYSLMNKEQQTKIIYMNEIKEEGERIRKISNLD